MDLGHEQFLRFRYITEGWKSVILLVEKRVNLCPKDLNLFQSNTRNMINPRRIKVIIFALAIAVSFLLLTFNVMILYSTAWKGPEKVVISNTVSRVERIFENETNQYYGLFSRRDFSD